jgi:hypothetical protein
MAFLPELYPAPYKAGSGGFPGQRECQLRRKLTLNCAVQQNGVDPPLPVRWRPAIGRLVTILLKNSVLESIESELGLITGSFSLLVATIGAR